MRSKLEGKVPEAAIEYCIKLWELYPFQFKVNRKRLSKLGDYRYDPRAQSHTVTVNTDLNPYQFLITYIHEVAHRVVHKPRSRQLPHGVQWKSKFQELMLPMLNPSVFPDDVLRVLAKHMKNPKASTAADPKLVKVLAQYDVHTASQPILESVIIGEEFFLRKRKFRKLEVRRTRALCLDLANNKRYLISQIAEISPINKEATAESPKVVPTKKSKKVNSTANNQINLFE
ncbi:SprT family zinc-dependent metalloprotease [Roseivirga seohaensis]|uniref:transcription elongation protein SprT n=1 Tax=Roseivirga seohaensis TaxID=1914963 RepID=UPI000A7F337A|nr:transcription elongation protein SprT [Roseivirga seohaensis]